jgi:hypothetical protein
MKILGFVEDTPILFERPKGIGRCYLCGRARNKSSKNHVNVVTNGCVQII